MAADPVEVDLALLCRQHGSSVLRRCRVMLRDAVEAEDAAQDVFMSVLTKGRQIREPAAAAGWIYRITTNLCLNRLRSSKRRSRREQHQEVTLWQDVAPADPYERHAAKATLDGLTRELDPLSQEIFVYRHLDGLTQEEIATLTGKSRRTIGKRLKKLDVHLATRHGEEES